MRGEEQGQLHNDLNDLNFSTYAAAVAIIIKEKHWAHCAIQPLAYLAAPTRAGTESWTQNIRSIQYIID